MESKYTLRILFFVVVASLMAAAFGGCSAAPDPVLARADALMEEHPDSVLTLLEGVDTTRLRRASDRALYALLLTQARTKEGEIITADTLINRAVDYYSGTTERQKLMRSLFYQADILLNIGRNKEAMKSSFQAYQISVDLEDYYWRAKIAEQIADLYSIGYNSEDVRKYTEESVEYYQKAGRVTNHRYSLCDLARSIGYCGDPERSIELLDSIIELTRHEPQDSALRAYAYKPLITMQLKCDRIQDASHSFDSLVALSNHTVLTCMDLIDKVDIELNNGNINDAENMILEAESISKDGTDSIAVIRSKCRLMIGTGRYREAFDLLVSILYYQNLQVGSALNDSFTSVQRDYYDIESQNHQRRSRNLKTVLFVSIVVLLIILTMIIFIFRMRIKVKNLSILNKVEEIARISKENEQEMSRLKGEWEKSVKEKWKGINELCKRYFSLKDDDKYRKKAIEEIEKSIKEFGDKEHLKETEECLNMSCNGIITRLREQCDFLSESELNFILLNYAGFKTKTIAIILDIEPNNYYKKRSRIADKIRASEAPDKETFVEWLGMRHV